MAIPELNALLIPAAIVGAAGSFLVCVCIVLTTRWHGVFSLDSHDGIQKVHVHPTPRIGGVGLLAGMVLAWLLAPPSVTAVLGPMLLAALPAYLAGFIEDVTKRFGVRERLLATMASGFLAWAWTGHSITSVGLWGIDTILMWPVFSALFTVIVVAGAANAVNIIDGFHGLAGGTVAIELLALGAIALNAGDPTLAAVAWIIAAVIFGFLLVNFPFGKIFLGDGGAYFLGFLMSGIAVMLPARNPSVSPWAPALICAYPVLEVLYSVYRRRRRAAQPCHPDHLHLHSLVKARLVRKRVPHWSPVLKNALVSPICWTFSIVPAIVAIHWPYQKAILLLAFAGLVVSYCWMYRRLIRFKTRFRWAQARSPIPKRQESPAHSS